MSRVAIDHELCTGDGICADVCPKDLLRMEGGFPHLPEGMESRCNLCGQCLAFCPTGAVSLERFSDGRVEPVEAALRIGPEQAEQFLKSRRSVRSFTRQPVSHEVILRLLGAARLAPSGGNNQVVRWIVVERPETVRELAELIAQWFDTDARTDPVAGKRYAIDSIVSRFRAGSDVILRGAPHLVAACTPPNAVWGAVDSAIALTFFNLAAHAHGVGCCWAGYFIRAAAASPAVRDRLGIAPDMVVQGAMVFGNARYPAYRVPVRNTQVVRWL
ncbi:nitroreductase family protein [Oleispirillum naphthae]|uniref:nitroreductase family protein n=1 Tax=Oleispirillum naphthae TaxID=2838853 RepID=UPI00308226BD